MRCVVCYDRADDARHESVFVANREDQDATPMQQRMERLVYPNLDCVHIVELCAVCDGKTVLGAAETVLDPEFYVR